MNTSVWVCWWRGIWVHLIRLLVHICQNAWNHWSVTILCTLFNQSAVYFSQRSFQFVALSCLKKYVKGSVSIMLSCINGFRKALSCFDGHRWPQFSSCAPSHICHWSVTHLPQLRTITASIYTTTSRRWNRLRSPRGNINIERDNSWQSEYELKVIEIMSKGTVAGPALEKLAFFFKSLNTPMRCFHF